MVLGILKALYYAEIFRKLLYRHLKIFEIFEEIGWVIQGERMG